MFFNDLALYRKAIYKMLDDEYDCDWYIEDTDTGVKEFEATELKRVSRLPVKKIGGFYTVKGLSTLLKKDYDIYFMLGATRNLSLISFCLKKSLTHPGKRVYFWTHGYYGKESWAEKAFWKRPLMKMADVIFTYGDYARELMVEDGIDANKIYPIHNSLDYETQLTLRSKVAASDIYSGHFKNENPTIIFIGRLTPVKRLDLLLDAVAIQKARGECYNLVFIGDGEMRDALVEKVKDRDIESQIWFYGECYDENKNAELIYNADLCVAPGNIGLTAIHVLMFGCPAVSHNNFQYQMPEFEAIKPGITGDFFEHGSVESLAERISLWFKINKNNRELVRDNCYKEIDKFWNPYYQMNIIKKHLNLI